METSTIKPHRSNGKYTVQEEVLKAESKDHPCRPTNTSVKLSFPGMESEVYVSFLGYREPSLVYLQRCQGQCGEDGRCSATRTSNRRIRMFLKSFLTGGTPRTRKQEVVLEEHLECGCECSQHMREECSGKFSPLTCSCGCPKSQYRQRQEDCRAREGQVWDTHDCHCVARGTTRVVAREVEAQQQYSHCQDLAQLGYTARVGYRGVDIAGWVLLGSCLSLVIILGATTHHYRKKAQLVKEATLQGHGRGRGASSSSSRKKKPKTSGCRFTFNKEPTRQPRAVQHQARNMGDLNLAIENTMLLSGGGGELYHEQYNEHGVKIENQLFS